MNIRKHLRNLFLVSTALFWANCSSDSDVSSPNTDAEGLASSSSSLGNSAIEQSSSATESSAEQAHLAETSSSEGYSTELASSQNEQTVSSSSRTMVAESSSSDDHLKVYRYINYMWDHQNIPDSCEPNRYGLDPKDESMIGHFVGPHARYQINKILSPDSGLGDSISEKSKECLESMLDTLSNGVMLYGANPFVTLDAKCSDGSIFYTNRIKNYAKDEKITEEEAIQKYEESYKNYDEINHNLEQQIIDCLDSTERSALPPKTLCYKDTIQNASGNTFDIIECDDGKKYLSHPVEDTSSVPEGIQKEVPSPTGTYAVNCSEWDYIHYEGYTLDENGKEQEVNESNRITRCPQKPEN